MTKSTIISYTTSSGIRKRMCSRCALIVDGQGNPDPQHYSVEMINRINNNQRCLHTIQGGRMEYSKTGLALTERFEGCQLTSYQDQVGRWTIGYGHTQGVASGQTCTQEEAEAFLAADVSWAVAFVNRIVKVQLTQGEFDALVDFTFNLGSGNFNSSTLLQLVNKMDFNDAADEFEKWDHAGGKVVAGLLRRRQAEEGEFKS